MSNTPSKIDSAFIYETIKYKYQNPVITSLPKIITNYIINNPHEHQRFLQYKLTVKRMITYISKNLHDDYTEQNLMKIILDSKTQVTLQQHVVQQVKNVRHIVGI